MDTINILYPVAGLILTIGIVIFVIKLHKKDAKSAWTTLISCIVMVVVLTFILPTIFNVVWEVNIGNATNFLTNPRWGSIWGGIQSLWAGGAVVYSPQVQPQAVQPPQPQLVQPQPQPQPQLTQPPQPVQPQAGCVSNQQVINAFRDAFGEGYWSQIVVAGLQDLVNNRGACFDRWDQLPNELAHLRPTVTEVTPMPTLAATMPTPAPTPEGPSPQEQLAQLRQFLLLPEGRLVQDGAAVWQRLPPGEWTVLGTVNNQTWSNLRNENWQIQCRDPANPLYEEVVSGISGTVLKSWGARQTGSIIRKGGSP